MELSKTFALPSNWTHQYQEVVEIKLSPHCKEYIDIHKSIDSSVSKSITRICRIQNPYLHHRFMVRKAEYVARGIAFDVKSLFHATAEHKVRSISENNLDWRLVRRCKFGRGVSFSDCAAYANKECSRGNGNLRAMLICNVLIGKQCSGTSYMTIPHQQYDTTTGNNRVFVKYYDDEFYPKYAAYYHGQIMFHF